MDEDIVIPNWDTSNLTPEEMDTLGELWKRRERKKKLRAKRKQRNQVLEDIKGIFVEAPSIDVDENFFFGINLLILLTSIMRS